MLRNKSIHELRAIAQGFGVGDIFSLDALQLAQAIELRQQAMIPEPTPIPPRPEYDARLMTKPPSKATTQKDIEDLLAGHIARGLRLTFPDPESWAMQFGKREDTGPMRMPLRIVLTKAEGVMK